MNCTPVENVCRSVPERREGVKKDKSNINSKHRDLVWFIKNEGPSRSGWSLLLWLTTTLGVTFEKTRERSVTLRRGDYKRSGDPHTYSLRVRERYTLIRT